MLLITLFIINDTNYHIKMEQLPHKWSTSYNIQWECIVLVVFTTSEYTAIGSNTVHTWAVGVWHRDDAVIDWLKLDANVTLTSCCAASPSCSGSCDIHRQLVTTPLSNSTFLTWMTTPTDNILDNTCIYVFIMTTYYIKYKVNR